MVMHDTTADRIILEPLPLKLTLGSGWYVKATHPDGRIEHVTAGFKSEAEAKAWIADDSADWLRDRGYSDE
jgi:hypothetical protein